MESILKSLCVCIESVLFNYEAFHIKKTWGAGGIRQTMGEHTRLKLVGF